MYLGVKLLIASILSDFINLGVFVNRVYPRAIPFFKVLFGPHRWHAYKI